MSLTPPPKAISEVAAPKDADAFAAMRAHGRPVVLRGLVANWALVEAARRGNEAMVDYLRPHAATRPVGAIAAAPSEQGRFFYNSDVTGFNFRSGRGNLALFLADLLQADRIANPPGMAVQSEDLADLLPHIAAENSLDLLPGVRPRIWIGNRIRVAPHYDLKENIACCVAGRRRFTVFPPGQTAHLYPGPLEMTPAGTPVSMVDLAAPDLHAFPRFADAWGTAQSAILEPGDAIYLPYCWWHGVESLDPVSILVNYWWNDADAASALSGSPHDALLHALLALRHLPPGQRAIWREKFDYYVFETHGDPAGHLPDHAKGVLGPATPALFARMKAIIRQALG